MGTNYCEKINAPVGIGKYGDIYIARDFFDHGDCFRGVTGDIVYPVTAEMISSALEADSKMEWAEDTWRADAGSANGTELGLEDWTNEIPDDEYLEMVFESADVDVEALNALTGIDTVRYALSGCGRVFHADTEWARVFDADLLARINAWEGN
jgi:hypothetical protein